MTPQLSNTRGRTSTIVALAAICAGLGWTAWRLANEDVATAPQPHPVSIAARADAAAAAAPPPALASLASLTETVQRPLFAASRRPAPAAPEAKEAAEPVAAAPPVQPEAPPSAEGFRLVGMIEAPGGGRRILLRANEQATGVWVREGDEVGGWRVSAIGPSAAVIEQRGTQVELRLFPR